MNHGNFCSNAVWFFQGMGWIVPLHCRREFLGVLLHWLKFWSIFHVMLKNYNFRISYSNHTWNFLLCSQKPSLYNKFHLPSCLIPLTFCWKNVLFCCMVEDTEMSTNHINFLYHSIKVSLNQIVQFVRSNKNWGNKWWLINTATVAQKCKTTDC